MLIIMQDSRYHTIIAKMKMLAVILITQITNTIKFVNGFVRFLFFFQIKK